jgi:hypothetical protein
MFHQEKSGSPASVNIRQRSIIDERKVFFSAAARTRRRKTISIVERNLRRKQRRGRSDKDGSLFFVASLQNSEFSPPLRVTILTIVSSTSETAHGLLV